ncbi:MULTISPECIES: large conductance mechanosensitive channel protein MscL [Micrococcaceae]|uniref:large conductance mechanosensitive channel protein MscL n=1 Tax=Micrococcaceae TaxID=1268 RepID=UPI00103583C4|nr:MULTISPECIES: large conductance mechanosensitive channel protein MscL [Micrococcaceae]TAP27849.1 large conductance mechanosensitive channel protein MscL [Arthrobacter sp. S41]UXN33344.1 large conductance mechanosensitive channel protein MscL [Glutamicibacter sp. M10]
MLKGFRDFIMKGNVVDLAVAVVIGAAFGAVVTALVDNILMPLIAALVGSPNFDSFLLLNINGVDIKFGVFLTALVNFLLIAAAVYFALVLPMQKVNEKLAARRGLTEEEVEEEPDPQLAILEQIRDELKNLR